MKMTFRWYGAGDPVKLDQIRQIPGMSGIVTAVYDVPVGEPWPQARIDDLRAQAQAHGLSMEVIESVPVHEHIKLGLPDRDRLIDNYAQTIVSLGKAGVRCICYNFMPVFDWLRSSLAEPLEDGSTCLAFHEEQVLAMDPAVSELSLPGWDESYTREELRALLRQYEDVDEAQLWDNLIYFLRGIGEACRQSGVRMAIHPDDPPWGIFGLPRIIRNMESLQMLVSRVDEPYNGVTFCAGSFGSDPNNDLYAMADFLAKRDRVPFVHARNVLHLGQRSFREAAHLSSCGSLDMYRLLKTLHDGGFDGYIRPDHGRMIWGETGRPGYGLYDRALGAAYLNGLWEAIVKAE